MSSFRPLSPVLERAARDLESCYSDDDVEALEAPGGYTDAQRRAYKRAIMLMWEYAQGDVSRRLHALVKEESDKLEAIAYEAARERETHD